MRRYSIRRRKMEWEQNKFCFFISLRKGCLIIGYLSLFVNIASLIAGLVAKKHIVAKTSNEAAETFKLSTSMFDLSMINRTLSLVFTIVLIVGLHKKKRHLIKIYLIFMLFSVLITSIVIIWKASVGASVMDMFFLLMSILFLAYYCLAVIGTYYVKLRRRIIEPTNIDVSAPRTTGTLPTAPPESDIS